jgi:hypothetical protein
MYKDVDSQKKKNDASLTLVSIKSILMTANTITQQAKIIPETKQLLAVSITLPVHSSIIRGQLECRLKSIELKLEEKLTALYSESKTEPVISKLKHIFSHLDYKTHKQGIAIFVSSISEQVYYLDNPIVEKIDIDEFFENGDEIIREKKKPFQSAYSLSN